MGSTHTNLIYHIVFSTKHRKPLIADSFRENLYQYIGGMIRSENGVLIEIGGMPDHLHILALLNPNLCLSDFMRIIKSKSSKWLGENHNLKGEFWQRGYSAFTVSVSVVEQVKQYIQNQIEHHRKLSFKEEFIALLEKHGIEYDEQFLWE